MCQAGNAIPKRVFYLFKTLDIVKFVWYTGSVKWEFACRVCQITKSFSKLEVCCGY